MHVLLGKKQIVLGALVVALGLAVFVNWYYSGTDTELDPYGATAGQSEAADSGGDGAAEFAGAAAEEEYFASVRLTRNNAHDSALEELQAVLASADAGGEAAANTAKAIETISNTIKMESDIESLVTSRTGSECVAVISDGTVEVVVNSQSLTDNNVLQISDVISEVCAEKYENIKISGTVS